MTFWSLAQIIIGFVGVVAVGWALRRTGLMRAEDARPINAIIIYVGLPAMIFRAVHPAHLESGLGWIAGVAWVSFAVALLAAWLASRALKLPRPVAGGLMLAAALGNTGYIGYPVSQAFFGDQGLVRAIFFDVFGTVGALLFVGLFVAEAMGAKAKGRINPLREALAFPALLALLAAFLLRSVEMPELVGDWLDLLASLTVPLIMISVGLLLRPGTIRQHAGALAVLGGIRLLLAPLVALAVGSVVLSDPQAVELVVLEASMPSMMLTLVIGERFGLDADFIASAILVTTAASVLTIPLVQLVAF